MNNTMDALKALFIALGGNEVDFTATIIPEAIALITEVAGGGSGGSFVVNGTGTEFGGWTLDKTVAEIQEAYTNGIIPVFKLDQMGELYIANSIMFTGTPATEFSFIILDTYYNDAVQGSEKFGGTRINFTYSDGKLTREKSTFRITPDE